MKIKFSIFTTLTLLLCTFISTSTQADLKIVNEIDEENHIERKELNVLGSTISYLVEGEGEGEGEGQAIVFIHGNPTSAYLWRNVIPHVSRSAKAIAPDLIGMGQSGKPDIGYSFNDHYRYFEAFIEKLKLKEMVLVGHDWGATIAWEYARKNPHKVKAIAFMEGVLPPAFPVPSFESMGNEMGDMFRAFKDEKMGYDLVVKQHIFIEKVLPGFVNRALGDRAMQIYRAPYIDESSRKPILAWPRQVPIAESPSNTHKTLKSIEQYMSTTNKPTLLIYANPGVVVDEQAVSWYLNTLKNIESVYVGAGLHFIQEDQPQAIGKAIDDWLRRLTK